ncbi:flagellar biosynthesis protein FlhB [Kineococcus gynurae]|uniref:Flagellar biosynthesis protein FlhB n=1 Tax=Kineococcus gynurae TaxID=452979 RepID=A0ABV5LR40_9ACTN
MSGEKTEAPTAKKLQKAKEEGNVPQSRDVSAWLTTAAGAMFVPSTIERGRDLGRAAIEQIAVVIADPDPAGALASMVHTFAALPGVLGPLLAATVLAAIVGRAVQGNVKPTPKKLQPKFSSLNPVNGFKQHWGPQGLWEGAKSLLKTAVIGLVLWFVAKELAPQLVRSGVTPLSSVLQLTGEATGRMLTLTIVIGLLIAVGDYFMNRRQIMKKLRMSKDDIKQEHKTAEGDPLLKGAIKSKQMQMSRNRMMADVAKADVVVVNPTHIAVALRYEPGSGAPKVVAKGAGAIAAKIRARAQENSVPIVKDVPLARSMYKGVKIGQEIPAELYAAVAKVLAFVMNLRTRGALTPLGGDAHTLPVA